ncbi:hypothetical protein ASF70_19025 [Rhizobium sp. Leaf321]|uniref:oxidoreductase n=1 Tax=Rhizobium sp. Leaf321 TaxID=1736335 RepID=UPI000715F959|nr:hypothetical protein [Rhizobium sp. Leaf321]KQQ70938.1 hypothetical protein ASF70_19025 [Rhizobium sp. Leaf321]
MSDRLTFFVAVNTGFITNGLPDRRFLDFYESRSSHELYCSIVGNVVVPGGYGSNASTPTITDDLVWGELARGIAYGGARPGIQLASAWDGYVGARKFVTSAPNTTIQQARALMASKGRHELSEVIDSFRSAARKALEHGFRHVQLHAAHGYLLSLLIDRRINPLADFVLDGLSSLAVYLRREGIETSIRISMKTGDESFDNAGAVEFQDEVAALPFDFVDLSSGFYNVDKRLIYPTTPDFLASRMSQSRQVASRHLNRNFIFSGRLKMDSLGDLPSNMHPGLCRDLIANPNFLLTTQNGCANHNKCHYYSRGKAHLTCGEWKSSPT